jgi:ABC-2 type transport system ATP-binding protein
MSLGMKRKLAIVTAFMHDPAILVLDEPTSGLDPMMKDVFISFIKDEKTRGKAILLSSHIFSEVDETCDRIAIIKDGRLVSIFVANDLRHNESKTFKIELATKEDFERFREEVEYPKKLEVISVKRHRKIRSTELPARKKRGLAFARRSLAWHFYSSKKSKADLIVKIFCASEDF